ncbi:hypothetical protein Vau01_125440 [Virgisporangium aurantiacum]|uniref:Uncharacterized protein n=2 Tax=Virgisporangium aurantiacum TaxID=175570 RepID=A0A8J3ZLK8_9ACTN|nr:hypothetical protein Vau01_125440 [Virgisporangium aurantiacum]
MVRRVDAVEVDGRVYPGRPAAGGHTTILVDDNPDPLRHPSYPHRPRRLLTAVVEYATTTPAATT